MLDKYVGGQLHAANTYGDIQTLLIVSKDQKNAIELMIDSCTAVIKSAHEVKLTFPDPKPERPKIIKFDPNFKKKEGKRK